MLTSGCQVILIIITHLKERKTNISLKYRFSSSDLEAEILSVRRNRREKKKRKENGCCVFNDFLHIRIICHFN